MKTQSTFKEKNANDFLTHTKKQTGITLIALVVTIVVLLILALVSISAIFGENGIIERTKYAKEKSDKSKIMEEIQVAYAEAVTNYLADGKQLAEEMKTILRREDENATANGDIEELVVNYKDYETILKDGKLSEDKDAQQVTDENPGILSGDGTEQTPYLIQSIEDLVTFSNNVNSGDSYEGKYVKLNQTLDFKSEKSYIDPSNMTTLITGEGFNPIGNTNFKYTYSGTVEVFGAGEWTGNFFKGTFDGNENYIKNLYIDRQNDSEISFVVGLFGVNSGTIKNLKVTGNVKGTMNFSKNGIESSFAVAGISGGNVYGTIDNCYSYVNLTAITNAECHMGIAGITAGNYYGTITNSKNYGNIIGNYVQGQKEITQFAGIGGIVGGCYGESTIDNCANYGNLSKRGDASALMGVGGLIGAATGKIVGVSSTSNLPTGKALNLLNSKNYGNIIRDKDSKGILFAAAFIGIIGLSEEDNLIKNCTSSGNMNLENNQFACGMVFPLEANVNMESCYVDGTCTVKDISQFQFLAMDAAEGGIVKMSNCKSNMNFDIYLKAEEYKAYSIQVAGYTDMHDGATYGGKISIHADKIEPENEEEDINVIFEIQGKNHNYYVNNKLFTEKYLIEGKN